MIENNGLYSLAKEHAPQSFRNKMRSTVRSFVDVYAGLRGLSSDCALPDFLIVGAQKAGTTSLFNWLVESGFVQAPIVKEVGFFDTRWHWPINYRGYFRARRPDCLIGEATPSYLAFPEVPERVTATLGSSCKIIVVLRDPVGRSVSHYFHERRLGFEKRNMYAAMIEEGGGDGGGGLDRRSLQSRHFSITQKTHIDALLVRVPKQLLGKAGTVARKFQERAHTLHKKRRNVRKSARNRRLRSGISRCKSEESQAIQCKEHEFLRI